MTDAPTTPPTKPAAHASRATRLRRDQESAVVDAKVVRDAISANLSALVAADTGRTVKRLHARWLAQFSAIIAAAEGAIDGRAVRVEELRAATTTERATAVEAADSIRTVRDDIATSYPDDATIGRAFGVGTPPRPAHTGHTIKLLGQILDAFANPTWHDRALAAGVTQARIDALSKQREALSAADMNQQSVLATNADGTVDKDALVATMRKLTAYARRVARAALRGQPKRLAAFRIVRGRTPARRGSKAATGQAPAPRRARGKRAQRRHQVRQRTKTLMAPVRVAKKAARPRKRTRRK